MTLDRKELAAILRARGFSPESKSAEFVDLFFEAMAETLEGGEKVKIPTFGVFTVREKKARLGRNPKTGERMEISARRVVVFRPSPILRKALNQGSV
jgi:integration host factor subunit alpha